MGSKDKTLKPVMVKSKLHINKYEVYCIHLIFVLFPRKDVRGGIFSHEHLMRSDLK